MTALTKARLSKRRSGKDFAAPAAAGAKIYAGAFVCINAAGFAVPGALALNLVCVGTCQRTTDNTAGANGAVSVPYDRDIVACAIDAGDPVTLANIGATVFMLDDNTVSKTNGGGTKSAAGTLIDVTSDGAWIKF